MSPVDVDFDDEPQWADVRPESSRRLLMAARDVFAVYGFQGATTRQVAEAAGMSPAGVYVHYATKADLLFEVSKTAHLSTLKLLEAVVSTAEAPPAKIWEFMTGWVTWHARNHKLARVSQLEDLALLRPEHAEEILRLRERFTRHLRGIIRDGVRSGDFEVTDEAAATIAILSIGIDVARWYVPPLRWSPDELGRLFAELALRMLGVPKT